jgi:hypothetical protein
VVVEAGAGDDVIINAGPLNGALARVLSVDEAARTGYLRLWVANPDGSLRRALAVLELRHLEVSSDVRRWEYPKPAKTGRGRPRTIDNDKISAIYELDASGRYSRASIAEQVGVSKSSVAAILKRGQRESRDPML